MIVIHVLWFWTKTYVQQSVHSLLRWFTRLVQKIFKSLVLARKRFCFRSFFWICFESTRSTFLASALKELGANEEDLHKYHIIPLVVLRVLFIRLSNSQTWKLFGHIIGSNRIEYRLSQYSSEPVLWLLKIIKECAVLR